MPANIDTMMFVHETPWHKQGTRLANPATAEEAIVGAAMGWEVQLQPIYTGPERNIRVKDRHAVCRTDRLDQPDGGQLGVVGRDYTPLQNREAFDFLDPVVGQGAAVYHTAGSLRGGRQIWLLAKLPGEIRVIGDDIAEKYVLLSNSHDGTSAVRAGITPIRVVCQNTLNLAIRGMGGLSIRHFPDVAVRVREAWKLLGIVNEAFGTAGAVMQQMAKVPMTTDKVAAYFERVMPLPTDDDDLFAKVQQRHHRLKELFETGIGTDLPGVRGTTWAAYNAVTQWVDRESYTRRHKEPLRSIWFGDGARLKERAYDIAAEAAGV
jgi:phage/plasmid-like protein (TIGR03299 family)